MAVLLSNLIIVPCAFICLFPMSHQLKYSIKKTLTIMTAFFISVVCLFTTLDIKFGLAPNTLLAPLMLLCFGAYHKCLKVHISKSLAVFLSVIALASILGNFSSIFDAFYNPSLGSDDYTIHYSLFHMCIMSISALLMFYPLYRFGSKLIDCLELYKIWYLTMPFSVSFICISLFFRPQKYETYFVNNVSRAVPLILVFLLFVWLMLHIVFYFIVTGILHYSKIQEHNRILEMQEKQFDRQQQYIQETAKYRHDQKYMIRTIKELSAQKNYDALDEFIQKLDNSLPVKDTREYCKNYALNALLNYYYQQSSQYGIRFHIKIHLPDIITVSDIDLCSIIGNILENALSACLMIPEQQREIELKAMLQNGIKLIVVAKNSFDGNVRIKNGVFLYSKGKRNGIGLSSITAITEKYNGTAKFHFDSQYFYSDIILSVP